MMNMSTACVLHPDSDDTLSDLANEILDLQTSMDGNLSNTDELEEIFQIMSIGQPDDHSSNNGDWQNKPVEMWTEDDTLNWLLTFIPFRSINKSFVEPGADLVPLIEQYFLDVDPKRGKLIYDRLQEQKLRNQSPHPISVDKQHDTNGGCQRQAIVWEFLIDCLTSSEYNPSTITWENRQEGIFRFTDTKRIAQLWGMRKTGNPNSSMTFDKFTRAMRYHYKSNVLAYVPGKKLVYRFGSALWDPDRQWFHENINI